MHNIKKNFRYQLNLSLSLLQSISHTKTNSHINHAFKRLSLSSKEVLCPIITSILNRACVISKLSSGCSRKRVTRVTRVHGRLCFLKWSNACRWRKGLWNNYWNWMLNQEKVCDFIVHYVKHICIIRYNLRYKAGMQCQNNVHLTIITKNVVYHLGINSESRKT